MISASDLLSGVIGALAGALIGAGAVIWTVRRTEIAALEVVSSELRQDAVLCELVAGALELAGASITRDAWDSFRVLVAAQLGFERLQLVSDAYSVWEHKKSRLDTMGAWDWANIKADDAKEARELAAVFGKAFGSALAALRHGRRRAYFQPIWWTFFAVAAIVTLLSLGKDDWLLLVALWAAGLIGTIAYRAYLRHDETKIASAFSNRFDVALKRPIPKTPPQQAPAAPVVAPAQ